MVILIILFLVFRGKNNVAGMQTGAVTTQNLQETVLSTGQVISGTDLSLAFQSSGVVKRIYVAEGDSVYKGQTLAILDQASALASLTTAQGSLAQAQANYDKLIAGSIDFDSPVIKSNQVALDSANQDALNALDGANLKAYDSLSAATKLQNDYFNGFDNDARIAKTQMQTAVSSLSDSVTKAKSSGLQADIDSAVSTGLSSLNTISTGLGVIRQTLDETYYYGIIPDAQRQEIDTQRTNINAALTTLANSQQAIANAKITLLQSQPQIDSAKAQILSAQGQVAAAQVVLSNTVISAPQSGVITSVDIKVGEQATAIKEAIVLQNVKDLHAEADVSEANIASLQTGQDIDYTFDALGPDQHFTGKVLTVNPASTVVSGVVNYKIKGSLENIPGIKPGMTANMSILVAKKDNVLAVPSTAVISKNDGNYVRVVDDLKKKTFHEVKVQTGLQADGGLIEIVSGLNNGQQIVTYLKK